MNAPANWYPDPSGRHQHRYWDGGSWTDHVSDSGVAGVDPLVAPPPPTVPPPPPAAPAGPPPPPAAPAGPTVPVDPATRAKIARQVSGSGISGAGIANASSGGATLFTEPVLVVNQKAKLIELNNQYQVFDQHGNQLGVVNQVGQSTAKKLLRFVSSLDQYMTHHLEVADNSGTVVLRLTRPRKVIKSTVIVGDGAGRELGRVVQANMVGKIRFDLTDAGGRRLGGIFGENWRAWNFRIEDAEGREVARITKTWEGLAKTMFTTADNYVVQIHARQPEPLNSLIIASALSVDTALKQDARGFG